MAEKPTYEKLEQKEKELTKEAYELRQVEKELRESKEDLRSSQKIFETVLDHLDGIVHASDLETYEVLLPINIQKIFLEMLLESFAGRQYRRIRPVHVLSV